MSIEQYKPIPNTPEDKAEAQEMTNKQQQLDAQKQQEQLNNLKKDMKLTITNNDNPKEIIPFIAKNLPKNDILTVQINNEKIVVDGKNEDVINTVVAKIEEFGSATMTLDTLDTSSSVEIKR